MRPLALSATAALAQSYFGVKAYRSIADLPVIGLALERPGGRDYPRVSIIVPARNEAHNIDRVLGSLAAQDYPNYEIIVVDDASSDGTGELAQRYPVKVVRNEDLPDGWVGKVHACHIGQQHATGEWLAFVDADTLHAEGSLSAVIAFCLLEEIDCASVMPQLECPTHWQRILMPWVQFQYSLTAETRRVNTVGDPTVTGLGQYMLFRRSQYEVLGGHAAVRDAVVEDQELASLAKQHELRYFIASGERFVSVLMHRTLAECVDTFTKLVAIALARDEVSRESVGLSMVTHTTLVAAATLTIGKRSRRARLLALVAYLIPALTVLPHHCRNGVAARYSLLHPIALAMVLLTMVRSVYRALAKESITWKGRQYATKLPEHLPTRRSAGQQASTVVAS